MSRTLSGMLGWFVACGVLLAAALPVAADEPPCGNPPLIAGCAVFPSDNIWNIPIDMLPLSPHSATYVASIGASAPVHPDFGAGLWEGRPMGIPFCVVGGSQPMVSITFTDYGGESDPGPYPVPPDAPIEGGPTADGDRHVLVLDKGHARLYELYNAFPQPDGSWQASSGAVFDLRSNALRPVTWTSADAAGLPILPGLVRYDEVATGEIRHAIRFTAPHTQRAYVWPARHYASSSTDPALPPMGQRFRLRAGFDERGYSPDVQVILRAMKRYGIILADNGSSWFLSGAPDERWDNEALHALSAVHGSDFEAVDSSALQVAPDSAQTRCQDAVRPYRLALTPLWNLTLPALAPYSVPPGRALLPLRNSPTGRAKPGCPAPR